MPPPTPLTTLHRLDIAPPAGLRGAPPARPPAPKVEVAPQVKKEPPKIVPAPVAHPSQGNASGQRAPANDSLIAESQLLSTVMQRWRRQNDPASALELLDAYQARFPGGVLHPEAEYLRVSLLVERNRMPEALALLDKHALPSDTPRALELRVLRAELRSRSDRCTEAIADFSQAMLRAKGSLHERALYGRYRCHVEQKDARAARSDLLEYLDHFPQGRFSAELRKVAFSPQGW